jgi:hypothetical protein
MQKGEKMLPSNRSTIPIVLISSFIILTLLGGCKTGNYGRLQSDPEATQAFESLTVLPNHKYYYRHTSGLPSAIVAIHEDFTLDSKLWTEIDTQSTEFKRLIELVGLQGMGTARTTQPWGFKILTSDDRYVGIWYSAFKTAAVDINEKNEIVTLAPTGNVTRGGQR